MKSFRSACASSQCLMSLFSKMLNRCCSSRPISLALQSELQRKNNDDDDKPSDVSFRRRSLLNSVTFRLIPFFALRFITARSGSRVQPPGCSAVVRYGAVR